MRSSRSSGLAFEQITANKKRVKEFEDQCVRYTSLASQRETPTAERTLHSVFSSSYTQRSSRPRVVCRTPVSALSRGQVDGSWRPDTNGYEYYVSALVDETERTWQEARALCMQNGGDLTSVLSENEKNFITTYVSSDPTKQRPSQAPVGGLQPTTECGFNSE